MKAIFSMLAFFCFALTFGIALVMTKWNEHREYEAVVDDDSR